MYQALYRKYRPKTFSDVVGQEHITKTIKSQVEKERTTHAYIFTGTRGTGKTSCAKILARAINCLEIVDGEPCNECSACKSILNESSLDVSEIDAASNNKVDDIREILEETRYTPANLKKRVYIIDEVHMLTTHAFNALLKTLEEPPPHVLFILATTEIHKVLPTILSRCQRYDFKRITMNTISQALLNVAQKEGISLQKDAADIIAKMADGGMRDALSMLDRCRVSDDAEITVNVVCERIGVIDYTNLIELMKLVITENTLDAVGKINKMYDEGVLITTILDQMLSLSRDMLLSKITQENSFALTYNISKEDFKELVESTSNTRLTSFIDEISNSTNNMQRSQNKKIDVELCIIKMCKQIDTKSTDNIIEEKIAKLEDKIANFKPEIIYKTPLEPPKKQVVQQTVKTKVAPKKKREANGEKGVEDFEKWTELLRNLKHIYKNRELIFIRENTKAIFYKDWIDVIVDDEITSNLIDKIETKIEIGKTATNIFGTPFDFEVSQKYIEENNDIDSVLDAAKNINITINTLEE